MYVTFVRPAAALRTFARSIIGAETSTAVTLPMGVTRSAAASVVPPLPQPRSSTLSPVAIAAASSTAPVISPNMTSTISAYCAQETPCAPFQNSI
jgi:hypothetical protein